jgi:hypothetical protein
MKLSVHHVEVSHIYQVWPLVVKWFEPVYDKSALKDYYDTLDQLKLLAIRGDITLLVGVDEDNEIQGAAIFHWNNMPKARIAYIIAMGGRLITSKENHEGLIKWFRAMGGTKIEGAVRTSVARLWTHKLGYTSRQTILELDI